MTNYVLVPMGDSCCDSCAKGNPCASGDTGSAVRAMFGIPVILGLAVYFVFLRK